MEFDDSKKSFKRRIETSPSDHGLHFYTDAPQDKITLQEFEDCAVDRLKVLRIFDNVKVKHNSKSRDYKIEVTSRIRAENLTSFCKVTDEPINAKRDLISHFILRLAFCKTEELRNWFLEQECALFQFRFNNLQNSDKLEFIKQNQLPYEAISDEKRDKMEDELVEQYTFVSRQSLSSEPVFKVCFTQVCSLLRKRKVILEKGFAYIPLLEMETLVTSSYRSHLSKALAKTKRSLSRLDEDDRCLKILDGLPVRYTGKDYGSRTFVETDAITADMIGNLSEPSFPPCMRNLYDNLHATHHLRHGGRMQFGLFLKGIGVTMEESLKFWKKEFCKKITEDEFNKKYAYNIRHNYGKEGKRTNYTPYSCLKIIMGNPPGPSDTHGCPFKHWDKPALHKYMRQKNVPPPMIQKMQGLVDIQHYNIACTCYFEAMHGVSSEQSISHPNHYFEESGKETKKKMNV